MVVGCLSAPIKLTPLAINIKQMPRAVVLAGHLAVWNPLDTPDRKDLAQQRHVGRCLLGMHPIRIEQQPSRTEAGESLNHRMQQLAVPRWVGDDVSCVVAMTRVQALISMCCCQDRVRLNIAGICAYMTSGGKVLDQRPVTCAWLNESRPRHQVRQKRLNSGCGGWVEVPWQARECAAFSQVVLLWCVDSGDSMAVGWCQPITPPNANLRSVMKNVR